MKPLLAIHGGVPAVNENPARPPRWGQEERGQLDQMLDQPSLFYWRGPQTALLIERFKGHYPFEYVMPCSSGTAALHIAIAASGIGVGDEVITAPITDMGSVIGILYQQAVPVFADLDGGHHTLNPADVERKITPRTRAVLAVHLAGNPCRMEELRALCDRHDLILIEDCAQAWGTLYQGQPIGTRGHIACYSFNDFKHISCGDGGIVASNDARFGPHLQKFGDKSYDREARKRFPDALAPNYRITEPQAAIAAAQLERMWDLTGKRQEIGLLLNESLQNTPGLQLPQVDPRDRWTCWFYLFRIDPTVLFCDATEFAAALNAEGLTAVAHYIGCPLYKYPVFQSHNFFAGRWPARELGLTDMDYTKVCCEEAEAILETCIQIPVHEGLTPEWAHQAAAAIEKVAAYYASAGAATAPPKA